MRFEHTAIRTIGRVWLLLGLVFAQPAFAQPQGAATEGGESRSLADSEEYEVIIVRARRRSEPLQDAPLAVSAFTEGALRSAVIDSLDGLDMLVPNLNLNTGDASNAVTYVRGIGQRDSLSFADPGVAVYLDDVYLGRSQGAVLDILDIDHIEVLRGPQGTLYGRNTIGGAVKYISMAPEDTLGGRLEARFGNYDLREFRGTFNAPLGENLATRINFGFSARNGYSHNLFNGEDDGDKSLTLFRGQLLWRNENNLGVRLSVDYSKNDPDTSVTPSIKDVSVVGSLLGIASASTDPFDINANFNNREQLTAKGIAATIDLPVNYALSFKSITSYRELSHDAFLDLDGDDGHYFGVFVSQEQDQFSQEFQALIDFSNDFDALLGVYHFQESDITPDGVFGTEANISFFGIPGLTQGLSTASTNDLETNSWAVFGEFKGRFAEKWEWTLGGRYTRDKKSSSRIYNGLVGFGNPNLTVADLADANMLSGSFATSGEKTFSAFTPKAGLSYRLNDEVLLYGHVSQGFKSGGFNGRARDDNEAEPFDEETVTSLEAGLKGAWFDERLVLNAAAFRNDYQDMQTSSFGSANASFIAIFSNAGEAVTQGVELELRARPASSLYLRLHLGYLDAEYKEYDAPNLGTGQVQDLSGLDLIQAPEFTYGLGLRWSLISNDMGRLTLNGQYSGSSSYFTTVMNEASLKEDGYGLLNLSLRWDNPRNGLSVNLSAANLTDEQYIIHGFDLLSYPGVALAYQGAPRTYALSVSWDY